MSTYYTSRYINNIFNFQLFAGVSRRIRAALPSLIHVMIQTYLRTGISFIILILDSKRLSSFSSSLAGND